jgi:hypothetical protein
VSFPAYGSSIRHRACAGTVKFRNSADGLPKADVGQALNFSGEVSIWRLFLSSSRSSKIIATNSETVSWQFVSLRQYFHEELSPRHFGHAKIANNGGHSRTNLRTALTVSEPEILSPSPVLSKPSDSADLVRFS